MHPGDATLHALLDRELAADDALQVEMHVHSCVECHERLALFRELNASTHGTLALLDGASPAITFAQVVARANVTQRTPRVSRWAAAAVLAMVVSAIAIAAPRSPVRVWLQSFFTRPATVTTPSAPSNRSRAVDGAPRRTPDRAGVSVAPSGPLRIDFAAWQNTGDIVITLVDSGTVSVRSDAGAAAFSTSATTLGVNNSGATASFDVAIPRRGAQVEIRVAGQRVFLRKGGEDRDAVTVDSARVTRISLVRTALPSQIRR